MTAELSHGTRLDEVLRSRVTGEVAFDDYTRHLFSRDASMYSIMPLGVVFPRNENDTAEVVRTAAEFGVPSSRAAREPVSPARPSVPAWYSTSPGT